VGFEQRGIKGHRYRRWFHPQQGLDTQAQRLLVLLWCLYRHAHAVKPGLKHGNSLLQGPTNPLAILRIRETQCSEIRQTIRAQGMTLLRKFE